MNMHEGYKVDRISGYETRIDQDEPDTIIGGVILVLTGLDSEGERVRFSCNQDPNDCPIKLNETCAGAHMTVNANDIVNIGSISVTCGKIPDFQPHLADINQQYRELKDQS